MNFFASYPKLWSTSTSNRFPIALQILVALSTVKWSKVDPCIGIWKTEVFKPISCHVDPGGHGLRMSKCPLKFHGAWLRIIYLSCTDWKVKRKRFTSRSSMWNFWIKFQAALMLACSEILFRGRAATILPTNASSVVFFADFVAGAKLRSFQERLLFVGLKNPFSWCRTLI